MAPGKLAALRLMGELALLDLCAHFSQHGRVFLTYSWDVSASAKETAIKLSETNVDVLRPVGIPTIKKRGVGGGRQFALVQLITGSIFHLEIDGHRTRSAIAGLNPVHLFVTFRDLDQYIVVRPTSAQFHLLVKITR